MSWCRRGVSPSRCDPVRPGYPAGPLQNAYASLRRTAGHRAAARALGLGFGNLVRLQVALAPDPRHADSADRAGFEAAWHEAQLHLPPTRPVLSILQVAGLGAPDRLVEIEATAARPPPQLLHVGH